MATASRPLAPRWRRQPEARPRQILEAAFHVFGMRGLHRATLDEVAKAAGITKGTIYLYFPSKTALFTAMVKARVTAVMPAVGPPLDGERTPARRRRLAALGRRLYRFFKSPAYLRMYRTVVSEGPQFPEAMTLVYREGILPATRRLAEILQAGMAAGEFRPVDPMIAARAFVGMFQIFAVSQGLLGGRRIYPMPEARVVRTVTDLFFQGLLAPTAGARGRSVRGTR